MHDKNGLLRSPYLHAIGLQSKRKTKWKYEAEAEGQKTGGGHVSTKRNPMTPIRKHCCLLERGILEIMVQLGTD